MHCARNENVWNRLPIVKKKKKKKCGVWSKSFKSMRTSFHVTIHARSNVCVCVCTYNVCVCVCAVFDRIRLHESPAVHLIHTRNWQSDTREERFSNAIGVNFAWFDCRIEAIVERNRCVHSFGRNNHSICKLHRRRHRRHRQYIVYGNDEGHWLRTAYAHTNNPKQRCNETLPFHLQSIVCVTVWCARWPKKKKKKNERVFAWRFFAWSTNLIRFNQFTKSVHVTENPLNK